MEPQKPTVEVGQSIIKAIPLKELLPLINWRMFFLAWKIQGKYLDTFPYDSSDEEEYKWLRNLNKENCVKAKEALGLYHTAMEMLNFISQSESFDGCGVVRFERASSDIKNLYISDKVFPMLRQQREGSDFLSCTDFIGENDSYIGLFAVTAGKFLFNLSKNYDKQGDTYKSLMAQTLADRIAEASAEWFQNYVASNYFPVKIRPAWGYPMLPDQTMILETMSFLPYEKIGIKLTENGAMYPPASISGLYFSNPEAKYFMVGEIGEDQIKDYAERRGIGSEKVKDILRQI